MERGDVYMYAVILAGGTGERFWPLSRHEKPKQFLSLFGNRSMLQLTMDRIVRLVDPSNVYVVTGEIYSELVKKQLPEVPAENIIWEPYARDTAAAVGLAAVYVRQRDPQGVVLVLPADHYVADYEEFERVIKAGEEAAENGEWIVTVGISPSRPETGYGYIEKGQKEATVNGVNVFKAEAFHEKPDINRALDFLNKGKFLWNSGMFIWRTDFIFKLLSEYLPDLEKGLGLIANALGKPEEKEVIRKVYAKLPRISIDYGVMEKTPQVLVIPAAFGWDDIGTWTALERYRQADNCGNILKGKGILLDTNNCSVYSPDKVAVTLGVEGLLIVNYQDSLLVCKKDRVQDIKKAVETLKEQGYDDVV